LEEVLKILRTYEFQQVRGPVTLVREAVGVCALITPWNWPLNQILCKVAPALAAGCTVVLKPSELAPLNAVLFAEVLEEAGVPPGVFNMVHGTGEVVGVLLSRHPDVDMVSFTGSTRAGIEVSRNAADTIKRVTLELGGKAANIVLSDADLAQSATNALKACFHNSGQTCIAPSRVLVQKEQMKEFADCMREAIKAFPVGDPTAEGTVLGPVAHVKHYEKIQGLIKSGLDEGAELVAGGLGRPNGLNRGYYVQATAFSNVDPSMTVAREEIFGPVICIIPYEDEADAIRIANDSVYGLGGGVQSADTKRAFRVASQIRTGVMMLNDATPDTSAPFGGYKQSGNGREWGHFGFEEFLEVKTVMGYQKAG
jgi:aldehyde dehydrogenase (NAD+)